MTQKTQDKWLDERLAYLRGLKAPSDQQRLLLLLADKPDRSADDGRKMAALIRAERAAERAQKARAEAARIIHAGKVAERKARDHALYASAGLMILAGLVDTRTGKPTLDRGELLGALVSVARAQGDEAQRAAWKRAGDALLAQGIPQRRAQSDGVGAQAQSEGLSVEALLERLDYGAEGCTAADQTVVSTLVAQCGAQKVNEEIDRLKVIHGRVFPSTLRKALGG